MFAGRLAYAWELLAENSCFAAVYRRQAAAASAAAVSAADVACEAAELADYHASTAHFSSYANDYFDDRAIAEMEAAYDRAVKERAEDSARWQEFGIYSD